MVAPRTDCAVSSYIGGFYEGEGGDSRWAARKKGRLGKKEERLDKKEKEVGQGRRGSKV